MVNVGETIKSINEFCNLYTEGKMTLEDLECLAEDNLDFIDEGLATYESITSKEELDKVEKTLEKGLTFESYKKGYDTVIKECRKSEKIFNDNMLTWYILQLGILELIHFHTYIDIAEYDKMIVLLSTELEKTN